MNHTPNLDLNLPDRSDFRDIRVLNENFEKLDHALKDRLALIIEPEEVDLNLVLTVFGHSDYIPTNGDVIRVKLPPGHGLFNSLVFEGSSMQVAEILDLFGNAISGYDTSRLSGMTLDFAYRARKGSTTPAWLLMTTPPAASRIAVQGEGRWVGSTLVVDAPGFFYDHLVNGTRVRVKIPDGTSIREQSFNYLYVGNSDEINVRDAIGKGPLWDPESAPHVELHGVWLELVYNEGSWCCTDTAAVQMPMALTGESNLSFYTRQAVARNLGSHFSDVITPGADKYVPILNFSEPNLVIVLDVTYRSWGNVIIDKISLSAMGGSYANPCGCVYRTHSANNTDTDYPAKSTLAKWYWKSVSGGIELWMQAAPAGTSGDGTYDISYLTKTQRGYVYRHGPAQAAAPTGLKEMYIKAHPITVLPW